MPYATVNQFRTYLPQAKVSDADETLMTSILARAESVIDGALGFSFSAYDGVATSKAVIGDGTYYLTPPPHQSGSVTTVTYYSTAYTDYTQRVVRGRAVLYRAYGWPRDFMDVTALWGYGPAPASIVEVCLELAVNIWRSKDKGMFTDVIGVESFGAGGGGAVIAARQFTNTQQDIVKRVKAQYVGVSI